MYTRTIGEALAITAANSVGPTLRKQILVMLHFIAIKVQFQTYDTEASSEKARTSCEVQDLASRRIFLEGIADRNDGRCIVNRNRMVSEPQTVL